MALNPADQDSDTTDTRIAKLYGETAREDSPRRLDVKLMAAAREGLTAPRPVKRPWWIGWQSPFAVAALGVISVGLVTLMMDEGGERVGRLESKAERVPNSPPSDEAPTEGPPVPMQPAPAAERQERLESARKASTPESPSAPVSAHTRVPAGPGEQTEQRIARDQAVGRDKTAPAPPTTVGADAAQSSTAPAGAPLVASPARGRGESEARVSEEHPVSPSAASRSAPASRIEPQLRRQEMGAGASSDLRSREVERHVRELEVESAQVWLDRIRLLRREGRGAEARELLTEFRRRFPEQAVPSELQ